MHGTVCHGLFTVGLFDPLMAPRCWGHPETLSKPQVPPGPPFVATLSKDIGTMISLLSLPHTSWFPTNFCYPFSSFLMPRVTPHPRFWGCWSCLCQVISSSGFHPGPPPCCRLHFFTTRFGPTQLAGPPSLVPPVYSLPHSQGYLLADSFESGYG
jgi:hypothetical protein